MAATLVAATALLAGASGAAASTHTWVGPPGGVWSNPAHWQEGAVPTSGEPGGTIVAINTNASSTMDINGLTVDKLSFNGTNSTIDAAGKTLFINGSVALNNIDSAGAGNSLGAGLTLQTIGNSTIFVRSQAGQFTINGPIAGNRPITFSTNSLTPGTGTKLRGSSTFTGAVTVTSGELVLDNNDVNAAITGSTLQIGSGSGSGATVKLAQSLEIADATNVRVLADGTLDLGGANDTFNDLEVLGGAVINLLTGTPSLTVKGALTMQGGTLGGLGAAGAVRVDGAVTATSNGIGAATFNAPVQVAGGAFQVSDGPSAVDLDLSAVNQTLGSLTVNGGSVALGTRTLTLGGALAMTGGSIDGAAAAQLVLGGNVTATSSASAGSVIGVATALAGARTFSVNAGAVQPELTLGGNITNGPATGSITKVGAGTMLMQPPSGNPFTGPTAVNDGRLQINSPTTPSIPTGALTIGDGIGPPGSAVVQALIEDDIKAPTTVNADGLLDMGQFGQNLPSLTINDGEMRVGAGAAAFAGQLSMTGGAITGAGSLNISAANSPPTTMTLTSSATGPARLAHTGGTFINTTTTTTVNPGVAPEFTVAGTLQVIDGSRLIKQGAGTALLKGSMIDQGALDVNAGTLIAEQPLLLATTVGPGATFAPQAAIGTSTVNGTLRPGPGTSVGGALSFGATGVLKVTVPSAVPAEAPRLAVAGAVAIASGATLDFRIASGVVLQPGTVLPLITNDLADAIAGQFANAPAGAFTEPGGHALAIAYAGGTGNDLEATVVAIPPTPTAPTLPTPPGPLTPPSPPAPTSEPAAAPVPSTKPANLSRLRLAPKSFRAASSGGPLTTKTSTRSTTVRFTLDASSTVEFTVARERPGIRSGAKCVAVPKRKPAKAKRCTRLVPTGTFSTSAAAGEATLRFTGRIGTRALAAGAYELAARPTGGVTRTTRFTILKPARR